MFRRRHLVFLLPIRTFRNQSIGRAMVTPRSIATELLKKRKEEKERNKSTILNSADIQVLGSFCQGHRPSLLVSSEGSAYLFNCGEGTQRNCYTNKVKLINLGNLFVTNHHWRSVSGAYGLSLTLQDLGIPSFTIHGARGLADFFKSVESFLSFNTGIQCKTKICRDEEYKDASISVKPVLLDEITPTESGDLKRTKRESRLISYICALPDLPGSLDPQKCRELKVPVGPKLAALKSGSDVVLDDGTLIKSSDVCGPKNRGAQFIVIDCPTISDINLVTKNSRLENYRSLRTSTDNSQIEMVFHFSPSEVYNDHKYSEWMNGFSTSCKHILLCNDKPSRCNFIDSYRLQYLLQRIDKDLFPSLSLPEHLRNQVEEELTGQEETALEYGSSESDELELKYDCKGLLEEQERIHLASALDRFVLRPHSALYSADTRLLLDATFKNASMLPDFDEDFQSYDSWRKLQPTPEIYEPEIVFLGTGSALPSKLRNTTCILINTWIPHKASMILDCGEDSYGQMLRFYGQDRVDDLLKHLRLIYISHHHADHHIGLVEILRRLKMLRRDEPVLLLAPPGIDTYLNYHNENFEDVSLSYSIISTKSLKSRPSCGHGADRKIASTLEFIRARSNNLISDVKVVGVEHCSNSCAVTFDLDIAQPRMKTFRISYSGDARPSEDFALIGKGCDLLIHEATFDHREHSSAVAKKHSTTSEAIQMAKRMRAKYTILTHFSQRYPKIPCFTEQFDETIGYAFDNMALRCPSHYARLPRMKTVLSNVFRKSLDEIEAKHMKMIDRRRTVSKIVAGEVLKTQMEKGTSLECVRNSDRQAN